MIRYSTIFWACLGSIAYTYAGYPAMLALLARTQSRPKHEELDEPCVTVLIAAFNEESIIASKLDNALALDYDPQRLQILVAADGSDDRTAAIVRTYEEKGVELSYLPARRGKMAAMNRAIQQATGEIVVFSDANNMYAPDVLRKLVAPFADPTVGGVTGAKSIARGDGALGDSEGLYWKYESFIKSQETRLGSCTGAAGEIFAIRRELYEPPPEQIINDDFYIAMRIVRRGFRVVYEPAARSFERVSLTSQDEMARRARIVAGRYQAMAHAHLLLPLNRPIIVWQVISHKFMRPLVPLAMIGALVANLFAVSQPARGVDRSVWRLASPFGWIMLGLQLVFYGLAWIGGRSQSRGVVGKALYVPTFLVNSNIAALVGLMRYARQSESSLWHRVQRRDGVDVIAFGDEVSV